MGEGPALVALRGGEGCGGGGGYRRGEGACAECRPGAAECRHLGCLLAGATLYGTDVNHTPHLYNHPCCHTMCQTSGVLISHHCPLVTAFKTAAAYRSLCTTTTYVCKLYQASFALQAPFTCSCYCLSARCPPGCNVSRPVKNGYVCVHNTVAYHTPLIRPPPLLCVASCQSTRQRCVVTRAACCCCCCCFRSPFLCTGALYTTAGDK